VSILRLFRPAPHIEEIQDQGEVQKKYRYWRFRTFIGMYVGYVFFYFTRKSLTFAMPAMMQELGLSLSDLGILGSVLSITYGSSKFFSGVMADRSNPRFFMAIGLMLTGVCNILLGFSSTISLFILFWGLNGWFQGWGWPPCAKLLTHWYSQKERGTWWGFWNTSHSVGGALIPILAALFAQYWGWRYAMFIPGSMCIGIGVMLMFCLRDTPQSLGLPTIENFRKDFPESKGEKQEEELSVKQILFKFVLNNRYIWILAISYLFVYLIRQAINDWGAVFLMKSKNYSLIAASASVFWFEMGGVVGSLTAGWTSDKIFQGRRGPINVLYSVGVIASLVAFFFSPVHNILFDYACMFFIGLFIFGPQMLIGIAAAELSHKKAAGSATGFIGWIAYLGAATAGYPISKVIEHFGWEGFFVTLSVCGALAVALLLPLWKIQPFGKTAKEQIKEAPSEPATEG
jgi:MFS transporter, OPA family, sugar phosphate sensor protein UhpC